VRVGMSENWRSSIRKVVKVQHDWKSTIREAPKVIHGKNGINGKDGLNGRDGIDGKNGRDGKDGKNGKDGQSANQIHSFDLLPSDDVGNDSDFAIVKEDKSLYFKENGKWIHRFHLSMKSQAPFMVGGISQQYVDQAIAAALSGGGGGGGTPVIQEVSSGITVTNQDVIICTGSGGYTITLKSLSTANKPVVVKNFTDSTVTVVVSGGSNIDDEPNFILEYRNGFTFNPLTSRYYVTG